MLKKLLGLLLLLIFVVTPNEVFAQGKRVEISLSQQHLYAYEGNILVQSFPISSGYYNPTPRGTFYPQSKLRYTRMSGGSRALGTYYDLPNVPYVVYFYQNYSIHGTYWHSNFGHPMSHGCVNAPTPQMERFYYWIDYSTPITIY